MVALTGKFPHTHFARGKRIKIVLRDGTIIIDKFVERRERFIITENHRVSTKGLKSVGYFKNRQEGMGLPARAASLLVKLDPDDFQHPQEPQSV